MSHGDRKGRLNVVKFLELVKKWIVLGFLSLSWIHNIYNI